MNAASASSGPTTMQHPATVLRKWCESVKPIETSFGPDCGYCASIYTAAVTIVTSGSAARQAELLAELVEESRPLLRVRGRRRVHPLEELRRTERGRHLPAHSRRAVGPHLVRGPGGHLEGVAALVGTLLAADRRLHPPLEHLEPLGLPWMQVHRRHGALARVARLHLEPPRRDRAEPEQHPRALPPGGPPGRDGGEPEHHPRSVQLLTCFRHSPLYYPAAWPSARTSSSPTR